MSRVWAVAKFNLTVVVIMSQEIEWLHIDSYVIQFYEDLLQREHKWGENFLLSQDNTFLKSQYLEQLAMISNTNRDQRQACGRFVPSIYPRWFLVPISTTQLLLTERKPKLKMNIEFLMLNLEAGMSNYVYLGINIIYLTLIIVIKLTVDWCTGFVICQ